MQVTVDLPDTTVRKLKALVALSPVAEDIESTLKDLIDMAATNCIMQLLEPNQDEGVNSAADSEEEEEEDDGSDEVEMPAFTTRQKHPASRKSSEPWNRAADVSGISDGLGDDDDEEPAKINPPKGMAKTLRAKTHVGVSDADLLHDMDLDDPSHEAKSEAPNFFDAVSTPEAAFTALSGLPDIDNNHLDMRAVRRKKQLKTRAKVTPFTGSEQSSF